MILQRRQIILIIREVSELQAKDTKVETTNGIIIMIRQVIEILTKETGRTSMIEEHYTFHLRGITMRQMILEDVYGGHDG